MTISITFDCMMIIIITIAIVFKFIHIVVCLIYCILQIPINVHNGMMPLNGFKNENIMDLMELYLIQFVYVLVNTNFIKTKSNQIIIKSKSKQIHTTLTSTQVGIPNRYIAKYLLFVLIYNCINNRIVLLL